MYDVMPAPCLIVDFDFIKTNHVFSVQMSIYVSHIIMFGEFGVLSFNISKSAMPFWLLIEYKLFSIIGLFVSEKNGGFQKSHLQKILKFTILGEFFQIFIKTKLRIKIQLSTA